jgi:uncharacterized protein YcbX
MPEPSTTTEVWTERVDAWRASGERAESFSRHEGYAASTLRWWASKLKRDLAAPAAAPTPSATPEVRLARVIRTESAVAAASPPGHAITLEVVQAGVRIGVAAGADRATLAMVLDVLGVGR